MQIRAVLVMMNRLPYKSSVLKGNHFFSKNFGLKVKGPWPRAPSCSYAYGNSKRLASDQRTIVYHRRLTGAPPRNSRHKQPVVRHQLRPYVRLHHVPSAPAPVCED